MTEVILSALISRLVSIDYLEIKQRTSKKKLRNLHKFREGFTVVERKNKQNARIWVDYKRLNWN